MTKLQGRTSWPEFESGTS